MNFANMAMPMIPHMDNLQQMDKTQLEGLLLQMVQMLGPDTIQEISQNPALMFQRMQMQQQPFMGQGQMRAPNNQYYQRPPQMMNPAQIPQQY